jgi:hypothetical protein
MSNEPAELVGSICVSPDKRHIAAHETETHEYCIHCERSFPAGYRQIEEPDKDGFAFQNCPYPGCSGSAIDIWPWSQFSNEPDRFPAIPITGVSYPMYPPC